MTASRSIAHFAERHSSPRGPAWPRGRRRADRRQVWPRDAAIWRERRLSAEETSLLLSWHFHWLANQSRIPNRDPRGSHHNRAANATHANRPRRFLQKIGQSERQAGVGGSDHPGPGKDVFRIQITRPYAASDVAPFASCLVGPRPEIPRVIR